MDCLPTHSLSCEGGGGNPTYNTRVLGIEVEDHVRIPISVDILQGRLHWSRLGAGWAKQHCGWVYSGSIEGVSRPDCHRDYPIASRVDAVRKTSRFDVDGDRNLLTLARATRVEDGLDFRRRECTLEYLHLIYQAIQAEPFGAADSQRCNGIGNGEAASVRSDLRPINVESVAAAAPGDGHVVPSPQERVPRRHNSVVRERNRCRMRAVDVEPEGGNPQLFVMPLGVVPEDPLVLFAPPVVVGDERVAATQAIKAHPEVDREVLRPESPDGVVANIDPGIPVEAERVSYHAGSEASGSGDRAVPPAHDLIRVAVSRPPSNHARGRWKAGFLRRC